jgi:hypothetical protein
MRLTVWAKPFPHRVAVPGVLREPALPSEFVLVRTWLDTFIVDNKDGCLEIKSRRQPISVSCVSELHMYSRSLTSGVVVKMCVRCLNLRRTKNRKTAILAETEHPCDSCD